MQKNSVALVFFFAWFSILCLYDKTLDILIGTETDLDTQLNFTLKHNTMKLIVTIKFN